MSIEIAKIALINLQFLGKNGFVAALQHYMETGEKRLVRFMWNRSHFSCFRWQTERRK